MTEKASALLPDSEAVKLTKQSRSKDHEVVDTKKDTSEEQDESSVTEQSPLATDTIPTNGKAEPVALTTGRARRNVQKPDRFEHNICKQVRVGQTVIHEGGQIRPIQQETLLANPVTRRTSKCRVGSSTFLQPKQTLCTRSATTCQGDLSHPIRTPCYSDNCYWQSKGNTFNITDNHITTKSSTSNTDPTQDTEGGQRVSNNQLEQLQARPRVTLRHIRPDGYLARPPASEPAPVSTQSSEEPKVTEKLVYVSDRTKRWVAENICDCRKDEWKCRVCHWQ